MNKELLLSRIADLCKERNISMNTAFIESGVGKNFKSNLKTSNPSMGKLTMLAVYFNVPVNYLLGKSPRPTIMQIAKLEEGNYEADLQKASAQNENKKGDHTVAAKSNLIPLSQNNVYSIPVVENVSAGFGSLAINDIVDYMPLYFTSEYEAQETICIKVKGDSMFPKIEDGDIIQVHKQTSVDSGSIAVVLLDEEEGLVKKVVYGPDWIELHSINPMYPVQRFEGRNVLRLRVVGLVKKIIKSV